MLKWWGIRHIRFWYYATIYWAIGDELHPAELQFLRGIWQGRY